jgi:hypothetical protein
MARSSGRFSFRPLLHSRWRERMGRCSDPAWLGRRVGASARWTSIYFPLNNVWTR